MNTTANCSDKLSREHYISKTILTQFGTPVVTGLPWQEPDSSTAYGLNALTSRILCDRHNTALSPLDDAAGKAFQAITEAMSYITKKSLARHTKFFLISGDALELWGIKTLLGLFTAKIARANRVSLADQYDLNFTVAIQALSGLGLASPLGLYIHPHGETVSHTLAVAPLISHPDKSVGGLRINMQGIVMDFLIDQRGSNPLFFQKGEFYRPWIIDLNGPKRTARIILTWAAQRKKATRVDMNIDLTRAKTP